jgi:alcohol dehydrogenase class IV
MLTICTAKSIAQTQNKGTGDTVTYVLYKDTVSFVSKKTVIYTGKSSVDSLADILAVSGPAKYRIVYEKQGQKPKVITATILKNMDRRGFYRITEAYNKDTPTSDAKPLYVISGK